MTDEPKRRRRGSRGPRYLIRRDDGDFGPFSVDEVKGQIGDRKVDLGSSVQEVGGEDWQPAGMFAMFREHYALCEKRWAEETLNRDVEVEARKLRHMDQVKGGVGKFTLIAGLLALVFAAWWVFRMMHTEATGIDEVVSIPVIPPLPAMTAQRSTPMALPPVLAVRVKPLYEPTFHDTAGVRTQERSGAGARTFDFDDDGSGLTQKVRSRIKRRMHGRIRVCAEAAARRGASFRHVRVTYRIRSGRLSDLTVGKPAFANKGFVACVKRAHRTTKVPAFSGSGDRLEHTMQLLAR